MIRTLRNGFSLVEMAVVLAIISVLLAFGMDLGRNAVSGSDRYNTQEELAVIRTALNHYAERHGYLPCPADPALLPDHTDFGAESRNSTPGQGCVASGGVVTAGFSFVGMLPFRNLGLPTSFAADAWDNKYTYAVSSAHVGNVATGLGAYRHTLGRLTVRGGVRNSTNYALTSNASGTLEQGATYVVISHGPGRKGAYPLNGSTVALGCTGGAYTDYENCDRNDTIYYDSAYNDGTQTNTFFDDFVVWGSNGLRLSPVSNPAGPGSCSGNCESWCAPCTTNIGAPVKNFLCSKFIIQSNPCTAACIWAGGNIPCP